VPGVLCTDIGQTELTHEAIAALVTCGALTPDPGMDAVLRRRYGFPERVDPAPAPAPGGGRPDDAPPENAPGGTGQPVADVAPGETRQPVVAR
jgi:hypothetical protein